MLIPLLMHWNPHGLVLAYNKTVVPQFYPKPWIWWHICDNPSALYPSSHSVVRVWPDHAGHVRALATMDTEDGVSPLPVTYCMTTRPGNGRAETFIHLHHTRCNDIVTFVGTAFDIDTEYSLALYVLHLLVNINYVSRHYESVCCCNRPSWRTRHRITVTS